MIVVAGRLASMVLDRVVVIKRDTDFVEAEVSAVVVGLVAVANAIVVAAGSVARVVVANVGCFVVVETVTEFSLVIVGAIVVIAGVVLLVVEVLLEVATLGAVVSYILLPESKYTKVFTFLRLKTGLQMCKI